MDKVKDSPNATPKEQFEITSNKLAPMPMTQEEVDAMAAGGAKAKAVVEQLSVRSTKAAPQPVYEAEMASIRESGSIPESVHERIKQATTKQSTVEKIEKESPKQVPPLE